MEYVQKRRLSTGHCTVEYVKEYILHQNVQKVTYMTEEIHCTVEYVKEYILHQNVQKVTYMTEEIHCTVE